MTIPAARYGLVRLIGEGGMGQVWEAHDRVLKRAVAVKRIRFPDSVSAEERMVLCRRAIREARAAAAVPHESIISVHDVLEIDDSPWIVMELIEGRSLREALPVRPHEAARIGLAVLSALTAAHAAGIVHRDVTPGNVLLADDGRVVLTDFGIAAIDSEEALTRTGTFAGSPGYVPPERLTSGDSDPSGDLFALGATLYTAVEGHGPFDRPTEAATLAATVLDRPARPRKAGPLRGVLVRLLRKDPRERPAPAAVEMALRRAAGERVSWWERMAWLPDTRWEYGWLTLVAALALWFLLGDRLPLTAAHRSLDVCAVAADLPGVRTRDPDAYCMMTLDDGRELTLYWWDSPSSRSARVEFTRVRLESSGQVASLPGPGDAAFSTDRGNKVVFRDGALVVAVWVDDGGMGDFPERLWAAIRHRHARR